MVDEVPAPNDQTADPNAPQFAPQAVYVKDVSFEAPAGPRVAPNAANPTINLNLNTSVNDLGGDLKEVVLTVRVEAQAAEKTVWLVELQQAGAFGIRNVPRAGHAASARHLLPELSAAVRARSDFRSADQGRLPAVPAAAGELRSAVQPGCALAPSSSDSRSRLRR